MNMKLKRMIFIFFAAVSLSLSEPALAGVTNSSRPEIFCEFSSNQAPVDRELVRMFLDGEEVTPGAKITSWRVSYTPPQPLAPGAHHVRVVVGDARGGSGEKEWSFTVDPSAADTTPPLVNFIAPTPQNGEILPPDTAVTFAISAADELSVISEKDISFSMFKNNAPIAVNLKWAKAAENVFQTAGVKLEPGQYEIRAKANDAAGNISGEIISAFSIAPMKNTRTESLPPGSPELRRHGDFYLDDLPGFVREPDIRVTGRASAGAEISLLVNGAPSQHTTADPSGAFSFTGAALLTGENTIAAAQGTADDPLGIQTPETIVTLDRTLPAIFDYLPGANDVSDGHVKLGFSFTDSESGIQSGSERLQVDGLDVNIFTTGNRSIFEESLEPGTHRAAASVCDAVGNCTTVTWGFVVPDAPVAENPGDDPWPKPDIDPVTDDNDDPVIGPVDDPVEPVDEPISVVCDILNDHAGERGKEIQVRCSATENSMVSLYINDILIEQASLHNGQKQAVFHKIELRPGMNVIAAAAEKDGLIARSDPIEVFADEPDDGKKSPSP